MMAEVNDCNPTYVDHLFGAWTCLIVGSDTLILAGRCSPKPLLTGDAPSELDVTTGGRVLVKVGLISPGSKRSEIEIEIEIVFEGCIL